MVMRKKNVKKASIEIVDGLKCVLEAQLNQRSKRSCIPILKTPVHRFCEIARKTERRFKKDSPRYNISRFLGSGDFARKKMGVVCSTERNFPKCDKSIGLIHHIWDEPDYLKIRTACANEVQKAIRTKPIERSGEYSTLLTSFETMRDWMHNTGYNLPDYVWVTPKAMRRKVKTLFEFLASREVRSIEDLDLKRREIQKW